MSHTYKSGSYLETWVRLRKKSRTWKKELKQWLTLGKMVSKGQHLEERVTLRKMGHTWKNESHLEQWVTPGKMGHT